MPLPLAPVAGLAIRYGTVALATYAVARASAPGRRDQRAEDALDTLDEGVTLHRDSDQMNGTARFARTIRLGHSGPAVHIDISALGRIRIRRDRAPT